MKSRFARVLLASLWLAACGDDAGDDGAQPADAGPTRDAARDGQAAQPASDGAVRDATVDAAAPGDAASSDAGTSTCGDERVACNGKCLSLGESSGNCTVFARIEGTDLRQIAAMVASEQGELFVGVTMSGNLVGDQPTIMRYAATGGAPTTLTTMRLNLSGLYLTDTQLYFSTTYETSTVRKRMTGSIGVLPRAGGTPQFLVRDLADGYTHKTDSYFYVASPDPALDPGLRRYDLMGKNETLLYDKEVHDFHVAGASIYFIDNGYGSKPIAKLPLAGGAATSFGGRQCQRIYGSDDKNLYASCFGPTRLALADGADTKIGDAPKDAEYGVLSGQYLYFSNRGYQVDGKLLRQSITDASVKELATLDPNFYPRGHVIAPDRAYVVLTRVGSSLPTFIVKVEL